ncbi:RICIN domain-containing protein [Seongchinamella unica]|nr:RICIN domain-containing protein [Seongchinamella unica]
MKRIFFVSAMYLAFTAPAQAVEFNTDALKSMQEEGHKIVAESQGARSYKASNGECLDFKGNGLLLAKCNDKKNSQNWTMDDKQRLVANNGRCIGGSNLQECSNAKAQKWTHDGQQRLISNARKCLQPQGNPPESGARVVAGNCSKSDHLVWK